MQTSEGISDSETCRPPISDNIYSQSSSTALAGLYCELFLLSQRKEEREKNIWAIKCQIAFQTHSSFQPHQEGCLKRQSAFVLTKYVYNYLFLKKMFLGTAPSKKHSG